MLWVLSLSRKEKRGAALLALLLLPLASSVPIETSVEGARSYILSHIGADGRYGPGSLDLTEYAIQSLRASGADPHEARGVKGGPSLVDYLRDHDRAWDSSSATDVEKRILAIVAAGEDPRSFPRNYVEKLRTFFDGTQTGDPKLLNDDIFAILALRAAGVEPDDPQISSSARLIELSQSVDGSWSYLVGGGGSVDITGVAIAALVEAGRDPGSLSIQRGLEYLRSKQSPSGGWGDGGSIPPNVQSTSWALYGFRAARLPDPPRSVEFLQSMQCSDGSLTLPSDTSRRCDFRTVAWPTAEGLLALSGSRLPVLRWIPLRIVVGQERIVATVPVEFTLQGESVPLEGATWDFGDGTISRGPRTTHSFPTWGNFTVQAEGWASGGFRGKGTLLVEVHPAPPNARLEVLPSRSPHGTPVLFSASSSEDPDGGKIVRFFFDFGDGNSTGWIFRPLALHTYDRPGNFTALLIVEDETGLRSNATRRVESLNSAPTLDLPDVLSSSKGSRLLLPNATDRENDPWTIEWRMNGSRGEGSTIPLPRRSGRFPLEVRVCDRWGACENFSSTIVVENLPPRFLYVDTPSTLEVHEEGRFLSSIFDPDGDEVAVRWWVDGKEVKEGKEVLLQFETPGRYTVLVEALDTDGGQAQVVREILVQGRPEGGPQPTPSPQNTLPHPTSPPKTHPQEPADSSFPPPPSDSPTTILLPPSPSGSTSEAPAFREAPLPHPLLWVILLGLRAFVGDRWRGEEPTRKGRGSSKLGGR